jgi:thiol-disulfide isomerase/thioredoxin
MLSKIKSYINDLSKKVIKDKRYLIILVIVLLVIVWGFYGLVYYLNNKSKETFVGNNEFNTNSSSTNEKVATVYLFSADWCPHCKKAEPEWVNFEKEYNNKTIKEYKIQCVKVNCTKSSPESDSLMEKYNVSGFPTVIMIKDGEPITFDAPVKTSTLTQFCYSML